MDNNSAVKLYYLRVIFQVLERGGFGCFFVVARFRCEVISGGGFGCAAVFVKVAADTDAIKFYRRAFFVMRFSILDKRVRARVAPISIIVL